MRQTPTDDGKMMRRLWSSIVRRPIRLFLPCWVSTLVVFMLIRWGFFAVIVDRRKTYGTIYSGTMSLLTWPPRDRSLYTQSVDLWYNNLKMFRIFDSYVTKGFRNSYNFVLWTVTMEYRGSLVLYITHAGLYFMSQKFRIGITAVMVVIGLYLEA